jgi:hypothetical protein
MGDESNAGHYKATCYYCNKAWARGKPSILKAHLANEQMFLKTQANTGAISLLKITLIIPETLRRLLSINYFTITSTKLIIVLINLF